MQTKMYDEMETKLGQAAAAVTRRKQEFKIKLGKSADKVNRIKVLAERKLHPPVDGDEKARACDGINKGE